MRLVVIIRLFIMCRLLGYIGSSISLDNILCQPEHSLIVQSYQPREMTSGLVNADGFGIGWYHPTKDTNPFTYRNILPIWSDINLPPLSRYIESRCLLGYVRSATPGQAVDLSNCQPFQRDRLLFIHNGFIKNFRQTLYRPLRHLLNDSCYQEINGTTDSEHIFALLLTQLMKNAHFSLTIALQETLKLLTQLSLSTPSLNNKEYQEGELTTVPNTGTEISANVIISDSHQLVASRFATRNPVPSLYWVRDDPSFPNAVIIASEPLFKGDWHSLPENSIIQVGEDCEIQIKSIY
jgi:ergothioneine biosynthesis protein EgtC